MIPSIDEGFNAAEITSPSVSVSKDCNDRSGSNSCRAVKKEYNRSIPALNLLTSVKELITIDKSSRMCPNAELAWEMTPISTFPAKYCGAVTMILIRKVRGGKQRES